MLKRLLFLFFLAMPAWAGELPFEVFRMLSVGMDKGEVLLRAGPPDMREDIESAEGGKIGERWYWIPERKGQWLTVITFCRNKVCNIERTRP
ncbi:MAG: hypothetical protein D6819_06525 [Gammaproteobacteria bacterium]|nr:MAG: hypothetical protein D6819_06525 [Gammaproteobacteria bacterium]